MEINGTVARQNQSAYTPRTSECLHPADVACGNPVYDNIIPTAFSELPPSTSTPLDSDRIRSDSAYESDDQIHHNTSAESDHFHCQPSAMTLDTCVIKEETTEERGNLDISMLDDVNLPSDVCTGMYLKECAACKQVITDAFLLEAVGLYWHEACLCCSCCGDRFRAEFGESLYVKSNMILCKRDYIRFFGQSGTCNKCQAQISPDEMVMKVKQYVYHVSCFACQQCSQRFNTGDKFYLCEGRILCAYDFDEQNLIAAIQRGYQYSSLVKSKRAAENLRDISC